MRGVEEGVDLPNATILVPSPNSPISRRGVALLLIPVSISQLADAALPSLPLHICGKKQTRLCLVCLYKSAE